MPRNPSGTSYSSPNTFGLTPREVISSSKVNANFQDIGNELVNSMPRDGRAAMTGQLRAVAGVEVLPGYAFDNDPDTGMRWLSSGSFAFTSNGSDVITVNADGIVIDKPETLIGIGDFYDTARDLDARFLKRDGALYLKATYPDLGDIMEAKNGALPDGVSWSNTNAITTGTVRKVQAVPGGFMMMVDDGSSSTKVFTTDETAASWSQIATIASFRVWDFVYQAGVYVAVDGNGKSSRSTDGANWTAPAAVATFTGLAGIAFAFGLFVVVGDTGKIATSPDGVTWTARTSGVSQFLFKIKYVNNVLIAVGGGGTIVSSTDGIAWSVRTSGVSSTLYDVAYGAGLYVITGASGVILTSANVTSWSPRTSGTTSDLNAIAYSTSGFVAAGGAGTVRISTDGITWAASITGTSINFQFVGFDPNNQARYFVGGNGALYIGIRTLPTQFRVPDDKPTYGWIRALNELP